MIGILDGNKEIEVAPMAAAPNATVMLADPGAEVIKVEPLGGDPWRFGHMTPGLSPTKVPWTTYIQNRTKKSVALNLKKPEAQEALFRLAATADVFLTNSPAPVQKALNHTYEDVKAVNPRIIYASINGFGQHGPDQDAPGFDATAWYARTGMMDELRPKDRDTVPLPVGAGDLGADPTLAGAAPMQKYSRTDWPNPVTGGIFETRDGRYIIIVEMNSNNIGNLRNAFGADHLKGDERFAMPQLRMQNHMALFEEMQGIVAQYDIEDVRARLKEFGVNFSVAQTTAECLNDEHMIANGCFPDVEGADGMRTIDSPIQINAEGMSKTKPQNPPAIGQHTISELLALGFGEDDIKAMAESKAIGLPR